MTYLNEKNGMSHYGISILLIPIVILMMHASPAYASDSETLETPKARQGYYISVGALGVINLNYENTYGVTGPWIGPGFEVHIGQAVTNWIDIGVGFGSAWTYWSNYRTLVGHLSMEAQLRPVDLLFIRLGVGFGFTDVTRLKTGQREIIGRVGGTYTIAMGYDFFMGRKPNSRKSGGWAISPYAGVQFGPSNPTSSYMGIIGVSISWWSGLNKNQLDLTAEEAYGL